MANQIHFAYRQLGGKIALCEMEAVRINSADSKV